MTATKRPKQSSDTVSSSDDGRSTASTPISPASTPSPQTLERWKLEGTVSDESDSVTALTPLEDVSSESEDAHSKQRVPKNDAPPRPRVKTLPTPLSESEGEATPADDGDEHPSPTRSSRTPPQTPSRYQNASKRSKPPKPLKRSRTSSPSRDRRPTHRSRPTDLQRSHLASDACLAPFRALPRIWYWFWGWEGWVLVHAYFAVPVALSIAGLMVAIAATGPLVGDWWWFCTVGDTKLGGLGYCQGGTCTTAIAYSVSGSPTTTTSFDVAIPNSFTDPLILCVLLYLFAFIGSCSSIFILYIGFLTSCRSSTTITSLNPCSSSPSWKVDAEDRAGQIDENKIDRVTRSSNQIPENQWEGIGREEKNRMRMETRFRMVFEKAVDVTALSGLPLAVALFAWVDESDAQGDWGFSALIAWVVLIPTWMIARKMFRATPKHVRDRKRQIFRKAKARLREKTRGGDMLMTRRGGSDRPTTKSQSRGQPL